MFDGGGDAAINQRRTGSSSRSPRVLQLILNWKPRAGGSAREGKRCRERGWVTMGSGFSVPLSHGRSADVAQNGIKRTAAPAVLKRLERFRARPAR